MSKNSIVTNTAAALGMDPVDAANIAENLIEVLNRQIIEGNSIAIPGFGQFDTVSQPEQIITDLTTGKRLMLPPVIEVVFTPATAITKETAK